jgi:hypothetical protein
MFSLQRRSEQVLLRSELKVEGRRREVAQTMYTYVSKCKTDKIKERKKKKEKKI